MVLLSILDLNDSVLSLLLIPAGNGLHFTFCGLFGPRLMSLITASELVFEELLKVCVDF